MDHINHKATRKYPQRRKKHILMLFGGFTSVQGGLQRFQEGFCGFRNFHMNLHPKIDLGTIWFAYQPLKSEHLAPNVKYLSFFMISGKIFKFGLVNRFEGAKKLTNFFSTLSKKFSVGPKRSNKNSLNYIFVQVYENISFMVIGSILPCLRSTFYPPLSPPSPEINVCQNF